MTGVLLLRLSATRTSLHFFVGDINVPEAQSQLFALMFSSYSPVASIVQSSCLKCVEVVLVIFAISHKRAKHQFALRLLRARVLINAN